MTHARPTHRYLAARGGRRREVAAAARRGGLCQRLPPVARRGGCHRAAAAGVWEDHFPLLVKQPGPRDAPVHCFIKRNRHSTCTRQFCYLLNMKQKKTAKNFAHVPVLSMTRGVAIF